MLDWFKKEEGTDGGSERTEERVAALAVLSNKRITLSITKVPATVGKKGGGADFSFYHDSVSNLHCRVECSNRQLTITDLGTMTGTQVNGKKLKQGEPQVVDNGDKLVIGKVKFDIAVNYEEIARREREAMLAAQRNAQPKPQTYTVTAREVNRYEYDESEVCYVSCGLEPLKKKATYTQEIKLQDIQDAVRNAEKQAAAVPSDSFRKTNEPKPAPQPVPKPAPDPVPVLVPEPDPVPVSFPAPEQNPVPAPIPVGNPVPAPEKRHGRTAPPAQALRLTCMGEGGVEEVIVDHYPFKIGRKKAVNDYVIRLDGISREHMYITEKDGFYYVKDLNSTNGVRVNGVKIPPDSEYRIAPGDSIKISSRIFSVELVK